MRLVLKQGSHTLNEFRFAQGPISIGRQSGNQVFLPDRAVSKKHAVLSVASDGKWLIEDMESANKTYLNGTPVHMAEIKSGDRLQIADFIIEIDVQEDTQNAPADTEIQIQPADTDIQSQPADTMHLEAALTTPPHEIIVRRPDAGHAPAMRLAATRLTDFSHLTEKLGDASTLDELLLALLNEVSTQFTAFHTWAALRAQPSGPMICHGGRKRDGTPVELAQIKLADKINQAVEKSQFLVMPRVAPEVEASDRIRSAMIASIMRPQGCFGVLYVDNAIACEHYSLSDLDYLMLLAIHSASRIKSLTK